MDADQLTDDEWRISSRKALKGFTRLDAKYFIPFFTRKFTRKVREMIAVQFSSFNRLPVNAVHRVCPFCCFRRSAMRTKRCSD